MRGTFCEKKNVVFKNRAIHFSVSHSNLKHLCELLRANYSHLNTNISFDLSWLDRSQFSIFQIFGEWKISALDVLLLLSWLTGNFQKALISEVDGTI